MITTEQNQSNFAKKSYDSKFLESYKKVAFEVPYNARCYVNRNNWNYMDLQCYGIFL